MTFESLVHDSTFASELTTTALGKLGLDRPSGVRPINASGGIEPTQKALDDAHSTAIGNGSATLLYGLAIPFIGLEDTAATNVLPDFAIVAPKISKTRGEPEGSWLIMGDAKDYERIRSRIDDVRLLKGFLQVALGAESAANWSQLPAGMLIHSHGVLAVPRNAFIQPEAVVELLKDHRDEVRLRVEQRHKEAATALSEAAKLASGELSAANFIAHLEATYDPSSCRSCSLFAFCRQRIRQSPNPNDLLIEIGVPEPLRHQAASLLTGGEVSESSIPESLAARVKATVERVGQRTQQARIDQAGQPGSINVVIAKSDSSAVGVYGIATQLVTAKGTADWRFEVFMDPQSPDTRRRIVEILGTGLNEALADRRNANYDNPDPVHLVLPDNATMDVLTSIADNLAGVELSRIRWERDLSQGREPLTFSGRPAEIPPPLNELARTAVSFLLEEDRARAFSLRCTAVDLCAALARHVTAGGPEIESFRLDYLIPWANASAETPVDHRTLSDQIEGEEHTPGARLTKSTSDAIHKAFVGTTKGSPRPADPAAYRSLVENELSYKATLVDEALEALNEFPDSNLRGVHRIIEGDAQAVWRRRRDFHASDLVRFGRTASFWRNNLVPKIEEDARCSDQLLALTNPRAALDRARDAGAREVASAKVVSIDPLILDINSRQFVDESRIALLHVRSDAAVEGTDVEVKIQQGSFKVTGLSIGPLTRLDPEDPHRFEWDPPRVPDLGEGDTLVVADRNWFPALVNNNDLPISRLKPDDTMAPKVGCSQGDSVSDPDGHKWCCRSHEIAESEWADELAIKRSKGELNPEVWPPVVDVDGFEVSPAGAVEGDPNDRPVEAIPDDLTPDDLD